MHRNGHYEKGATVWFLCAGPPLHILRIAVRTYLSISEVTKLVTKTNAALDNGQCEPAPNKVWHKTKRKPCKVVKVPAYNKK